MPCYDLPRPALPCPAVCCPAMQTVSLAHYALHSNTSIAPADVQPGKQCKVVQVVQAVHVQHMWLLKPIVLVEMNNLL